jgi:hypothetical protein
MGTEYASCEVRTRLLVLLQVVSISQLTVSRLSRQCAILDIWQPYRPPRPVYITSVAFLGCCVRALSASTKAPTMSTVHNGLYIVILQHSRKYTRKRNVSWQVVIQSCVLIRNVRYQVLFCASCNTPLSATTESSCQPRLHSEDQETHERRVMTFYWDLLSSQCQHLEQTMSTERFFSRVKRCSLAREFF